MYIAAFAPAKVESVKPLVVIPPPARRFHPSFRPRTVLFLDRDKFAASFAGDMPGEESAFMADSQVPWGVDALSGAVSRPAWRASRVGLSLATTT